MSDEKRKLCWIRDDDGNATNVVDAGEVAALFQVGKEVQITLKTHPILRTDRFPDEEMAKEWANQIAEMMGLPRADR